MLRRFCVERSPGGTNPWDSGLQSYSIQLRRAITTFGYFGEWVMLMEKLFVLILFAFQTTAYSI